MKADTTNPPLYTWTVLIRIRTFLLWRITIGEQIRHKLENSHHQKIYFLFSEWQAFQNKLVASKEKFRTNHLRLTAASKFFKKQLHFLPFCGILLVGNIQRNKSTRTRESLIYPSKANIKIYFQLQKMEIHLSLQKNCFKIKFNKF